MTKTAKDFFEPVDETSLRDQVAMNIRRAIDAGALKPGERLVEADIAAQMGISRAPVREAIRVLQREGFVISIPRKGSFVVDLEREDIEEIYSLRPSLEGLAVRLALPRMTEQDVQQLEDLVDEMRRAAQNREFSGLVENDLEFHRNIVAMAGHQRLFDFWNQMSTQLRLFLAMKDQLYENPSDVAETHQPLIDAFRARDSERAEKLMCQHIVEAGEMLLSSLEEPAEPTGAEESQ